MTPTSVMVGSGKRTDVPSEALAASQDDDVVVSVSYRHELFTTGQSWPVAIPAEVAFEADRRRLLAIGYSEQAAEAEALAEETLAAQAESLQDED